MDGGQRLARGVALAVLAAAAVSCAANATSSAGGSSSVAASGSATESLSASVPPLHQTFTSPLMGYSVAYPEGWTPVPATELWEPGAPNFWDDPVGDRIESDTAGFRGTSQALAAGQSPDEWLNAYLASAPTGCGEREEVPVGGETATIDLNGCAGLGRLGGSVFDVVLVAGNRGYNFTMEGDVDHALLIAMLATVSLDPAGAAWASDGQ
jgi:hypothetical protein